MNHMSRIHYRGTIRSRNRTSVTICVVDIHAHVIEAVDFTALIFEEVGHIIRAVVLRRAFG